MQQSNASEWVPAFLFHYERAEEIMRGMGRDSECVFVESIADYLVCEHKTSHNRRVACDTTAE